MAASTDMTIKPYEAFASAMPANSASDKSEKAGSLGGCRPVQKKCGNSCMLVTGIFLCAISAALIVGAAVTRHPGFVAPIIIFGATGAGLIVASTAPRGYWIRTNANYYGNPPPTYVYRSDDVYNAAAYRGAPTSGPHVVPAQRGGADLAPRGGTHRNVAGVDGGQ